MQLFDLFTTAAMTLAFMPNAAVATPVEPTHAKTGPDLGVPLPPDKVREGHKSDCKVSLWTPANQFDAKEVGYLQEGVTYEYTIHLLDGCRPEKDGGLPPGWSYWIKPAGDAKKVFVLEQDDKKPKVFDIAARKFVTE
ncbi:hypothetical protein PspLS_07732 [Pyricularia sp. CBS 133598]|nr:hypothetical protein PspLS_07732 [Pyricularia sp. CBS 133598]